MREMKAAEATDRIVSVSFTYTEREFMAAYRGIRMARGRDYDSFIMRLPAIVLGHVFLFTGIAVVVMWLSGWEGPKGAIPWGAGLLNVATSSIAAWALYTKIYFYRRHLRSLYRRFDLRDEKVFYRFTPLSFILKHKRTAGSCDWGLVDSVTELRDGFVIRVSAASEDWIPKHAFEEPFEEIEISNLLRSKVMRFNVVDRVAALAEKPTDKTVPLRGWTLGDGGDQGVGES
jgi:hypothetical protein